MIKILVSQISFSNHEMFLCKYLNKFPPDYISKILSYLKWEDQQMSLIGRLLLFRLLDKDIGEVELKLINNKLKLKDDNRYFSISHSVDTVVCAISDVEIGVDVEKINEINLDAMKICFTNKEWNHIKKNQSRSKFYDLWTKKESLVKLLKENTFNSWNSFEVIDDTININNNKIYFYKINFSTEYICHVSTIKPIKTISLNHYDF